MGRMGLLVFEMPGLGEPWWMVVWWVLILMVADFYAISGLSVSA